MDPIYKHISTSDQIDLSRNYYNEISPIINKPKGIYACRTTSDYNWEDWCIDNDFDNTGRSEDPSIKIYEYYFKLKSMKDVLIIHPTYDFDNSRYFQIDTISKLYPEIIIDWNKIFNDYAGIELVDIHKNFQFLYYLFYGWDIDSIVVWDLSKIELIV